MKNLPSNEKLFFTPTPTPTPPTPTPLYFDFLTVFNIINRIRKNGKDEEMLALVSEELQECQARLEETEDKLVLSLTPR
jgi:hypothetical protein